MIKRRLILFCCLILSLVVLCSGCSGGSGKTDTKELIIWGEWTGENEKQVNKMLEKFNQESGIKAKYLPQQDMVTKFLTASVSGQVPDLIIWDRFMTSTYSSKNVILPINEYIEKENISLDDYFPQAIEELTYDDKLYGMPLNVDGWGLYVNKTLLKEKGLKTPTTWEELRETAKALTVWENGKLKRAGLSMQQIPGLFYSWIQTAGGKMLNDDQTTVAFNSKEGMEVLNFWNTLLNEDKVYQLGFESGLGEGVDAFVTGQVAMTWGPLLAMEQYQKYSDQLEFEYIGFPAGPRGDQGGLIGGFGLSIPTASKNHDASWELIKWWVVDEQNALEWAKISKTLPGNLKMAKDDYFTKDTNFSNAVKAMEVSKLRPTVPGYSSMESQVVWPQIQAFFEGQQSAEETLKSMEEQGNEMLAQYKEQNQ